MALTPAQIKVLIDQDIRQKVTEDSIPPPTVAYILDALADLIDSMSIGGGSTTIPLWNSLIVYNLGDLVLRNRIIYRSQINGNLGLDPATDLVNWFEQADLMKETVTVNLVDGKVGGYENGDIVLQGTSMNSIIKHLLTESVPPIYTPPTLVLSSTNTTHVYEIGETVTIPLLSSFTQNDAGSINNRSVKRNSVEISTLGNYTDVILMNGTSYNYQTRVNYNTGILKNDSEGIPDSSGRILGGYIDSNTLTYIAYRKAFFGTNLNPTNSGQVRSLSGFILNPLPGSEFIITIPVGSVQVAFAFPAGFPDVTSVKYIELADSEIKGIFNKTIVSVAGASGYTGITYKVYVYTPCEPYSQEVKYKVVI